MCIFGSKTSTAVRKEIPEPEKTATPEDVGSSREAEDEALFGTTGAPQLRVSRSSTATGVQSSGTGLRLM